MTGGQHFSSLADLRGAADALRARADIRATALIVGKLDDLDSVNSRHGYAAGDQLIAEFQQRLADMARADDTVFQLSGDRFALLVANPLHTGHVMLAAEKIVRLADEWVTHGDERLRAGVWLGCALAADARQPADALISRAEAALRRGRSAGKRIEICDRLSTDTANTATHPLFDARKAIENGEFRVHYQPQFGLQNQRLIGAEALVRWAGPDGLQSPASFMNELERARSLMPLLQFIINNSSREMSRWMRRQAALRISVNSSANDLEDADLVEIMSEVLGMWNVDPQHLTLEITETSLMRNPEVGIATLHQLRELGMRTSIDDFGTGYSSLTWLKDLPVDELKIDRSFVVNIATNEQDRRIVETIIELAHAMEMSVVAEGIESAEVLDVLRAADCDVGQGFYFGEALSGTEFERTWLVDPAARMVQRPQAR